MLSENENIFVFLYKKFQKQKELKGRNKFPELTHFRVVVNF